MCPDCGSTNLRAEAFDFGRCPETGYADAGELYRCLDCGASGPAEDADVPAAVPDGERRAA